MTEQNKAGFKIYLPEKYDIKVWIDVNGKYHMQYKEVVKIPDTENIELITDTTKKAIEEVISTTQGIYDYKIDIQAKDKIYVNIEVVGEEEPVFNYLVSEFMVRSSFAKLNLWQLMAMLLNVPLSQVIAEFSFRQAYGSLVEVKKPEKGGD